MMKWGFIHLGSFSLLLQEKENTAAILEDYQSLQHKYDQLQEGHRKFAQLLNQVPSKYSKKIWCKAWWNLLIDYVNVLPYAYT